MMQRGNGTDRTDSPSFRMDSPDRIPAAAAAADDLDTNNTDEVTANKNSKEDENSDDDDDFEFSFIRVPDSGPPIAADDIFSDGKIRPIYPVFNRDLLIEKDEKKDDESSARSIRLPLRRLFIEEERERASFSSTSSSSSTDELDQVPPGTYCVWNPNKKDQIKTRSSSTGSSSSLRWRLRDLVVGRSHSDGKEKFVFIPVQEEKNGGKKEIINKDNNKGKKILGKKSTASTAKTFLPYKPDIVGFFANVNGVNRTTTRHPF